MEARTYIFAVADVQYRFGSRLHDRDRRRNHGMTLCVLAGHLLLQYGAELGGRVDLIQANRPQSSWGLLQSSWVYLPVHDRLVGYPLDHVEV